MSELKAEQVLSMVHVLEDKPGISVCIEYPVQGGTAHSHYRVTPDNSVLQHPEIGELGRIGGLYFKRTEEGWEIRFRGENDARASLEMCAEEMDILIKKFGLRLE